MQRELDTETEEMQEKVAVLEKTLIQLETDAPVNRDEHEKCKQEMSLLQVSNYI